MSRLVNEFNAKKQLIEMFGRGINEVSLTDILAFVEQVYELAYGDDAINKEYSDKEVLEKLRQFSDHALLLEEAADMLDTVNVCGGEDFWEADLDGLVRRLMTADDLDVEFATQEE